MSEAAAAMLKAAVTAGKRDASYTLARYLTAAMESPAPDSGVRPGLWREPDTPEGSTDNARTVARMISESIPVPQRLAILEASARQMLETFAPTEALRFVNTADTILERYASEATSFSPLLLYDYGHTAAFLTGDGVRMSRYFTRLHGRVDRLTLNRLRELWVTRCSDRMWIAGAWRIGRIILADLGAIPTGSNEITQATVDARKALTHRFLRRVGRQIRRSAASATRSASNGDSNHGNREDQIIGRTAIRVLLPTLSVAPDTAALFAWIILKDFDRYSAPPVTLLGLVYWSMALRSNTRQRKMIRTIRRLGEALMATLKNNTETWSEHTAMALVYGEILFTEWQRDTDGVEQRLFEMYSRGLAAGSPDAAAHSISLYCQWLFLRGFPLDDVYATMDHYRTETAALGHTRTATSIAKYQQAAEVLLGRTSVPDRLTGSLIQDEEIERGLRVTKDTLALFGYYILRVFIGVYHNAPNVAYQAFQPLIDGLDRVSRFFDINAVHFYYGIATSQLNLVDELRGQIAALARRRREPAGQHRYLALRAEHAYHRGHRYLARRRFRRAADLAVLRGFPSEAAIIAERDGTINGNIERLALAAGLYRRWGASRAEERVSAEMARLRRPPEGYIAFRSSRSPVQDGAEVPDAVLRRTRSYFHLLLATIPDALLLINTEGLVLLRNGAAESYVVRGSRDEEHLAPPYDRTILPLIQQTITDRTHLHAEREIAGQLVELTVSPAAFRPEGNAEGDRDTGEAAVVVRDITTLREREQQLILADRMTSLGMLASTVAHEVSNPNHIVQLNAQVLQLYLDGDATRSPGNEAAIREAVHNVLEGARRIDGVVRRVVDYGRGGAEQRWASIDPIELCNRVISFTRLLVTRSNEGIVFTRYEPLPPTTAVASLIEQALINLVKNAVEAVGANGGEIALSVDARDRWLVFSVCDQGPGIEATITDPTKAFVTSRSEQGGGGLGLSIVRSIAEKHGGRLVFARDGRYNTVANLLIPHDYGVSGESVA
ncbi:MAG: two-component system sensor histidine kinase NtrB, partial [Alkalispirochaeta sp.]